MLSTCSTRSGAAAPVVSAGNDPCPGAPWADQDTDHVTTACTSNEAWSGFPSGDGWPADDVR